MRGDFGHRHVASLGENFSPAHELGGLHIDRPEAHGERRCDVGARQIQFGDIQPRAELGQLGLDDAALRRNQVERVGEFLQLLPVAEQGLLRRIERDRGYVAARDKLALAFHIALVKRNLAPLDHDRIIQIDLAGVQLGNFRLAATDIGVCLGNRQRVIGWIDPE